MSIRTERIAEQLRQEISVILRDEVTDPRVETCSITRIELSRDLSHAQVFWSPLVVGDAEIEEMEDGLGSAAGYVRKLLARRLALRHTPEIHFRYDPAIGEGDRMLALLKDVRESDAARAPEEVEGDERDDERDHEQSDGPDAAGEEDDGTAT